MWPQMQKAYAGDEYVVKIRDKEIRTALTYTSLSGSKIRKVALPRTRTTARCCAGCCSRTCPAVSRTPPACSRSSARTRTRRACSPAKAIRSAPTALQAAVSEGMPAKRLSTAFDSVTLYGNDPDPRPDIYGKVGNSGRQHRHARRHEGAVLRLRPVRPNTSVSMTINGPAPTILAMFMNTAIDQNLDKFKRRQRARADRRRGREDPRRGCWRTCAAPCRPTS